MATIDDRKEDPRCANNVKLSTVHCSREKLVTNCFQLDSSRKTFGSVLHGNRLAVTHKVAVSEEAQWFERVDAAMVRPRTGAQEGHLDSRRPFDQRAHSV